MEHAAASLLHHTLQLLASIRNSIRTPSASAGTESFSTTRTTTHTANALIILFAGPGNNGGDAYALARLLHLQHLPVLLIPVGPPPAATSDAAVNRAIAERLQLPFLAFDAQTPAALHTCISAAAAASKGTASVAPAAVILIDALLGTGASRPLSPEIADAVNLINELRQTRENTRTLAVDLPTGLDADTGEPLGTTGIPGSSAAPIAAATARPTIVRADRTVALAALKPGLLADAAGPYIGQLEVGDIGLPNRFIAAFAAASQG
jgi:NAD(P)H-hydrate epimerase